MKPITEKRSAVRIAFDYSSGRVNRSILQLINHGDGEMELNQTSDRKLAVREEVLHDLRAASYDGLAKAELTGTGNVGVERRAVLQGLEDDGLICHRKVGSFQIYLAIEFAPPPET